MQVSLYGDLAHIHDPVGRLYADVAVAAIAIIDPTPTALLNDE